MPCSTTGLTRSFRVRCSFLAGHDVDQEVKHVGFGEGGCNIGSLQGSALVVFGVDPCAHCELSDEDVAALGEENWRFCGDHLHFGVGFHHLLYTR